MNISHIVFAILFSGFAASMTDWFFGGILFHRKYLVYPEIWRRRAGQPGEGAAIAWSILLGFLTCAAFILTCSVFRVRGYSASTLPCGRHLADRASASADHKCPIHQDASSDRAVAYPRMAGEVDAGCSCCRLVPVLAS
jgi:hypothetical protein